MLQPKKEPPIPRAPNPTPIGDDASIRDGNPSIADESTISIIPRIKKSKYESSPCKQQTKPYFSPNLGIHNLWLYLFCMGGPLLILGLITLFKSEQFRSIKPVDYTDCRSINATIDTKCSEALLKNPTDTCICNQTFKIRKNLVGRIILSYELIGFHQNTRPYVVSKDENHIKGKLFDGNGKPLRVKEECKPFDISFDRVARKKKTIYPCGRIANSMFSDEIVLISALNHTVPLKQISPFLKKNQKHSLRFHKPSVALNSSEFTHHFVKPKAWSLQVWNNFVKNNGVEGFDFIRWSRTSAFATFRNQYRVFNGGIPECKKVGVDRGLCKGEYTFQIQYSFEVASFNGRKKLILATEGFVSDENQFIVISLLAVGSTLTGLSIPLGIGSFISRKTQLAIKETEVEEHLEETAAQAQSQGPQIPGKNPEGQGVQPLQQSQAIPP